MSLLALTYTFAFMYDMCVCMHTFTCAPKSPFRIKKSQLLRAAKDFVDDFARKSTIAAIKSCLAQSISCHK